MRSWQKISILLICLVILAGGVYEAERWHTESAAAAALAATYKTPAEADNVYVRFDMEAYDDIESQYWQQVKDSDLAQLFQLSAQKATASSSLALATSTRAGTAAMLESVFKTATSTDEEQQWALTTLEVALYNLAPTNRDQLLSQVQQTQLKNEVTNTNPSSDLYSTLGVANNASSAQINAAYQSQVATLSTSSSPQAQQQLAQVTYAHGVLTNTTDKTLYDSSQAEPTVFGHIIGSTLYLYIKQISPTTLAEFASAVDQASTTPGLSSMLIDMRGNIGGDLSFAQAFLGLFLGANQYAFDLFHQGSYDAQRTTEPQFSELSRYTNTALLVDNMTQSTAELTTSAMERFHLATVVGTTTRGWGSVETEVPLKTSLGDNATYSLLLVTYLTLGDSQQPIEANGVTPNVSISDANWKSELGVAVGTGSLYSAVIQMEARDPWEF